MCKEGLLKTNISQGDLSLFPLILVLGIISFNRNPKFPHTFLSLKQIRIVSSFKGKKKKTQLPRPVPEGCAAPSYPTLGKHRCLFARKGGQKRVVNNLLLSSSSFVIYRC